MHRLVVLGTGTAVGKTYVTTALASALHRRFPAAPVLCLKPIETGIPPSPFGTPAHSDAAALEHATFNAPLPSPHPLHPLPDPISPHLAARRAGLVLAPPPILAWVATAEAAAATPHTTIQALSWSLIETPGGVFSPLAPGITNLHLARALDPALWLLVAPDALGVIHDLTATLFAMRHIARGPDLVVLTTARPPDSSTGTNAAELRSLAVADVAAVLPRNDTRPAASLVDPLLSAPSRP
jgi:dethiobiotin synthetase